MYHQAQEIELEFGTRKLSTVNTIETGVGRESFPDKKKTYFYTGYKQTKNKAIVLVLNRLYFEPSKIRWELDELKYLLYIFSKPKWVVIKIQIF